jgi:hypothetical protein
MLDSTKQLSCTATSYAVHRTTCMLSLHTFAWHKAVPPATTSRKCFTNLLCWLSPPPPLTQTRRQRTACSAAQQQRLTQQQPWRAQRAQLRLSLPRGTPARRQRTPHHHSAVQIKPHMTGLLSTQAHQQHSRVSDQHTHGVHAAAQVPRAHNARQRDSDEPMHVCTSSP